MIRRQQRALRPHTRFPSATLYRSGRVTYKGQETPRGPLQHASDGPPPPVREERQLTTTRLTVGPSAINTKPRRFPKGSFWSVQPTRAARDVGHRHPLRREIGSASCRERVCQYG